MATNTAPGAAQYLPTAKFAIGDEREAMIDGSAISPALRATGSGAHAGITVVIAALRVEESLGPRQVAAAITEGVRAAMPSARVLHVPLESGPGFMEEVVQLSGGMIERVGIPGFHREPAWARLGLIGPRSDRAAVIDLEEIVERRRPLSDRCDPSSASSRDAGELIAAALDLGLNRIIIGCGDSGAVDGGIGMATALGIRFLDVQRAEIVEAGGLQRLDSIDMSRRDPRLDGVSIEAVVDPGSYLLGEHGIARTRQSRGIGSQAQMLGLERGLARYADVVRRLLGIDTTVMLGGGAAGGLGAGLVVFAGARLTPRFDFLRHCPGLESSMAEADLVITADEADVVPLPTEEWGPAIQGAAAAQEQTEQPDRAAGAAPARPSEALVWIARQARALGLPVISLGHKPKSESNREVAGDSSAATSMSMGQGSRDEALARSLEWLREASARAIRTAWAQQRQLRVDARGTRRTGGSSPRFA